jgi:hypothetical protein
MRLLSWLRGRQSTPAALRAARALRKRYGDQAGELASMFVANAADGGDEEARGHWSAVCAELRRITVASKDSKARQKTKEPKPRGIEWD